MRTPAGWCGAAAALLGVLGCREPAGTTPAPSAQPSAPPAVSAFDLAPPARANRPRGPLFAIVPGEGLGPIRFGATPATVGRHLGEPCEELTPTHCRYPTRGVDFELTAGVVSAMEVIRPGRVGAGGKTYGVFHGAIPPDLAMGMTPEAVKGRLGAPTRVEQLDGAEPNRPRERHFYPGAELTYDLVQKPMLALAVVRIIQAPAGSAVPSAATRPEAGSPTPGAPTRPEAGSPTPGAPTRPEAGSPTPAPKSRAP